MQAVSLRIETVIDIDLANFFGTIDQTLLIEMLEVKIKDAQFIIGSVFKNSARKRDSPRPF